MSLLLADEAATLAAGGRLARAWRSIGGAGLVTLAGPLGSGKTTFVRGFVAALGHRGPVRSPSYTLLESYDAGDGRPVWHLDLYRLGSAAELENLGFRDLDLSRGIALVEWPERVPVLAARADLAVALDYAGTGRRLTASARRNAAEQLLRAWLERPAQS